ncbi:hypothetical protein N7471_004002 [Penicillium samsonianum]|uniref:uncharacterized protein n=1 Tax=Penicillium samsonianum TaxID=1882272 RepID=UPI002546FD33|nr:uncharacterized protein N7471_004002 [Penicillium samsonianum]KAJ6137516.1 hypothetical protein N7471_004002 [Penicillium samsonianum]
MSADPRSPPQTHLSPSMRFRALRETTRSVYLNKEPSVITPALVKCCISLLIQLSVESGEADKDENGNTQFVGIDGLVEKYTQTIERNFIG